MRGMRRQGRKGCESWRSWSTRLWVWMIMRLGNSVVNQRLGRKRRHAGSWMRATRRGRIAGGGAPSPTKTIAHGRLSGWMRESSNNTIGGMRCPRCVSATEFGEVRKDGINITRLSIDQVIFQG